MVTDSATIPFNEYLRSARGSRPLLAIARAGGPDPSGVSRYESGERLPSLSTLKWLCDFYGLDFLDAIERLNRARTERDLESVG
jgi:transcriptional regulator with XRE-family HTH domain